MVATNFENDEKLDESAALGYFSQPHLLPELVNFRGICNGIKACAIETAVKALRQGRGGERASTLGVLDLGSGRGGDLAKLGRYRLRFYLGVDGCATSVLEARERHRRLVTNGRSALPARFEALDFRKNTLPLDQGGADLVTCQFSLQFAFDTSASASHLLSEISRVLRPGGVVVGILPDGNRLASLLESEDAVTNIVTLGHFSFRKFEGTARALRENDPPTGIAYTFSLGHNKQRDSCPEYVVSPAYLHSLLDLNGFEPVLPTEEHSVGAQQFYNLIPENRKIIEAVTRKIGCSQDDWTTLGAFRVLLSRRRERHGEEVVPSETANGDQKTTPLPSKRGRRGGKRPSTLPGIEQS
jgi:mRNA (guanine-N7-)-methyltransferase